MGSKTEKIHKYYRVLQKFIFCPTLKWLVLEREDLVQ